MKPTVVSSTPIPGWDCRFEQITDDQAAYVCSPSDATIALAAWLRWKAHGGDALRNWLAAEDELLVLWTDGS